ncbi:MAG: CPBP family intramembrane metalloprotease [Clostridia bacterium]|nr:CPBP family intramembrane metalloprotease [Clostridia bacterium]
MIKKARAMRADIVVLLLLLTELALSLVSAYIDGITGELLFYASYLLPLALFLFLFAQRKELAICPTATGFFRILPLLPIFLASVLLLSTLTGFLMELLGLSIVGGAAGEGSPLALVLSRAVVPAILEESLMRLCVLSLLARRSPVRAIPQSALLFALLHASFYQLPYAFVGGIFLAIAALWGGSVLYAMLFHLLNNLLSLLMQIIPRLLGETAGLFLNLGISLILFLLAAWGALVLLRRHKGTRPPSARGWLKELLFSPLIVYILLMLLFAC